MKVEDTEKLKEKARKVSKFVYENIDLETEEFSTEEIKTAALVVGNSALNAISESKDTEKVLAVLFVAESLIRAYEHDLELSRKSGHA